MLNFLRLDADTPRWRVRLFAAAWVAVVAAVPAYIAADQAAGLDNFLPDRLTITLVAIVAAALSGYWIGWRLINPKASHSWGNALLLSALIWILAYYLLAVLLAAPLGISLAVETIADPPPTIWEALIVLLLNVPGITIVVYPPLGLYFGILMTGWYTLPVALIAGYILSRRYGRPW